MSLVKESMMKKRYLGGTVVLGAIFFAAVFGFDLVVVLLGVFFLGRGLSHRSE